MIDRYEMKEYFEELGHLLHRAGYASLASQCYDIGYRYAKKGQPESDRDYLERCWSTPEDAANA